MVVVCALCSLLLLTSWSFLHLPLLTLEVIIWYLNPNATTILKVPFPCWKYLFNFWLSFSIILGLKKNSFQYSLLEFFNLDGSEYQCHSCSKNFVLILTCQFFAIPGFSCRWNCFYLVVPFPAHCAFGNLQSGISEL